MRRGENSLFSPSDNEDNQSVNTFYDPLSNQPILFPLFTCSHTSNTISISLLLTLKHPHWWSYRNLISSLVDVSVMIYPISSSCDCTSNPSILLVTVVILEASWKNKSVSVTSLPLLRLSKILTVICLPYETRNSETRSTTQKTQNVILRSSLSHAARFLNLSTFPGNFEKLNFPMKLSRALQNTVFIRRPIFSRTWRDKLHTSFCGLGILKIGNPFSKLSIPPPPPFLHLFQTWLIADEK